MKLIYDSVEISSWGRWEDPGEPLCGAGSALPDGPPYPEEISGFCIWEVNDDERRALLDQFDTWLNDRKSHKISLEEAGELVAKVTKDISVDYKDADLYGVDLVVLDPRYILVTPTHWKIDGDDHGGPDEKAMQYDVVEAKKILGRKGLL